MPSLVGHLSRNHQLGGGIPAEAVSPRRVASRERLPPAALIGPWESTAHRLQRFHHAFFSGNREYFRKMERVLLLPNAPASEGRRWSMGQSLQASGSSTR